MMAIFLDGHSTSGHVKEDVSRQSIASLVVLEVQYCTLDENWTSAKSTISLVGSVQCSGRLLCKAKRLGFVCAYHFFISLFKKVLMHGM
jgi:hypothetical protein